MLGSVTHFSHFSPLYQQQPLEKAPTDKLDHSAVANTTGEKADLEKATKAEKEPSKVVKMFQEAKKLMNFYKDGIKLLWANNKTAKSLKEKVEKEGYVLSRDEYQLIKISEKDMIKLIPFAAVFLILAEAIPLIVAFAPSLVPSTCVTPTQIVS
ncbi:hypothetical protein INT43_004699 [Umbelopsis isabellina]|uniref:Uncharacterized protein n=1 Tax=Mortierella isabellina TaxID=91625 RepID=A0A8H7PGA3_MORIS|nr:hypothetical protein INT43_004699 [Umbelopsis isabellina]